MNPPARPLHCLLGLFLLAASGGSQASGPCLDAGSAEVDSCLKAEGWRGAGESRGVEVYTREGSAGSIREVLARTLIDAEPAAVREILEDFDRYTEFMPETLERSEIVGREDGAYYVFQQLDLPLVDDRYYTIRLEASPAGVGDGFRLSWELAPVSAYPRRGRGERVPVNRGFWSVVPTGQSGQSRAVYFVYTDPGDIWAGVANLANRVSVPALVASVRERAERAGAR